MNEAESTGPLTAASRRDPNVVALVSAYLDLVFDCDTTEARDLAISAARLADVERLVALGRAVRDPLPWRVFLACLLSLPDDVRNADSVEAANRMYANAHELLQQQGLGLVRPEDCLARTSLLADVMAVPGTEH